MSVGTPQAPWPPELLRQPVCRPVWVTVEQDVAVGLQVGASQPSININTGGSNRLSSQMFGGDSFKVCVFVAVHTVADMG